MKLVSTSINMDSTTDSVVVACEYCNFTLTVTKDTLAQWCPSCQTLSRTPRHPAIQERAATAARMFSAPPAQKESRPMSMPTNDDTEITDADLDAALMKIGLSVDRVKSLRANLRATGMLDADIRTQLLSMSNADVRTQNGRAFDLPSNSQRPRTVAEAIGLDANAAPAVVLERVELMAERLSIHEEMAFLESGKKRGAIALGFDEEEMRAAYRRSPREARAMLAKRPDGARTPVGLSRDSAPSSLPGEPHPAHNNALTTADLDGALKRLGLSDQRIASMRNNLKAAGMSSVEIDNEMRKMTVQA